MKKIITVMDLMQKNYRYALTEPIGSHFASDFAPQLTPKEMLTMGVFGGKYMTDCKDEFPKAWFTDAKLCHKKHDPTLNYFKVNASQPLIIWQQKGWINPIDPRGWFQWYCRYFLGRRIPSEDLRQIKRWKAMVRHVAQIKKNCMPGDQSCRVVQKQALLHWAYDATLF